MVGESERILVVGAGYVGIPTALVCAKRARTQLWDLSAERVEEIRGATSNRNPLEEPGLGALVQRALLDHTLSVHVGACPNPAAFQMIVLCVGTPLQAASPGLVGYDHSALETLISSFELAGVTAPVVIRSTCDPEWVQEIVRRRHGFPIFIAPEFLREGHAVDDTERPSRVVIGAGQTPEGRSAGLSLARLLLGRAEEETWTHGGPRVFVLEQVGAALVKIASNALLAEKIRFGARLSMAIERAFPNVDGAKVTAAMEADRRIGIGGLSPGLGPGGPCLPKDSAVFSFLMGSAVESTEDAFFANNPKKVAIWGLGFKPDSADLRSSPMVDLARRSLRRNVQITIWDPRLSRDEIDAYCIAPASPDLFDCDALIIGALPIVGIPEGGLRAIWDPYALLGSDWVRRFRESGGRYYGGGRGQNWPDSYAYPSSAGEAS